MSEQPTTPQWICEHCFFHLVNGDCTESDACCNGKPGNTPMALFGSIHVTTGMLREYHDCEADAEECDCEDMSFSWSACDGCGSNLGGARHAVTGWISD